jgi:hypothetical protein
VSTLLINQQDPGAPMRGVIEIFDNSPLRVCFKPKAWNDIKRASLYEAGLSFIVGKLPLRFGPFAFRLGYRISYAYKVRKAMILHQTPPIMTEIGPMRWDSDTGQFEYKDYQRLLGIFHEKVKQGQYRNTREQRKLFFEEFKRNLRRKLRAQREANVAAAKLTPMVLTGDMQTMATQNKSTLEVRMPFGHGVQAKESEMMRRVTDEENAAMAKVVQDTMHALIDGAKQRIVRRGTAAGQRRLSLTPAQRKSISHTNNQRPRASAGRSQRS